MDNALLDQINNLIWRGTALSLTGPFVVSLHTGDPGANRANEVSTGVWTNYARVTVARSTAQWDASASNGAGGRHSPNTNIIDFGTAAVTGTAPVVTHAEVWDSAGTPVRVGGDALVTPMTINNGNPVTFPAGMIRFPLTPV